MVRYENILKVIDNYLVKCPTIAEMRTRLNNMSQDEKWEKIDSLLNEGERKYYNQLLDWMKYYENYDESQNTEFTNRANRKTYGEKKEKIFQVERKIFGGYPKVNEPLDVDVSRFKEDVQQFQMVDGEEVEMDEFGNMEQVQINAQSKVKFTDDEIDSMQYYYDMGAFELNSYLWNPKGWTANTQEKFKAKLNKADRNLHNAIEKAKGLKQDTVVFRGARFDVSKTVGDSIKFKGYTSASFQKYPAELYSDVDSVESSLMYKYRILLPKGTKGLCGNGKIDGENLSPWNDDHEYLLDKGSEFNIVDIDYDNQVVTIIKTN